MPWSVWKFSEKKNNLNFLNLYKTFAKIFTAFGCALKVVKRFPQPSGRQSEVASSRGSNLHFIFFQWAWALRGHDLYKMFLPPSANISSQFWQVHLDFEAIGVAGFDTAAAKIHYNFSRSFYIEQVILPQNSCKSVCFGNNNVLMFYEMVPTEKFNKRNMN